MISNNINLNHLRIFEVVYRVKNMTQAAGELHLTQSGVSQHIASLEDTLGVKLFDRVKHRLIPTSEADRLYQGCATGFGDIQNAIQSIEKKSQELRGIIRIGVPIEFGNNWVLPGAGKFGVVHPGVEFKFLYGFATEMNDELLSGKLDLAFVDEFPMDSQIEVSPLYDEELVLCGHPKAIRKVIQEKESYDTLKQLSFVDYQAGAPLIRRWFEFHYPQSKKAHFNIRATAMDVQGIARLIESGLGCGILPTYLVMQLQEAGRKFYIFKGKGKTLKNRISLAGLKKRTQSQAVRGFLAEVWTTFRTFQNDQ